MGQAKLRGTYAQRKKEAVERNEKARVERIKKQLEIERAKTPEQREREREAKLAFAQFVGIGLGSSIYSRLLR